MSDPMMGFVLMTVAAAGFALVLVLAHWTEQRRNEEANYDVE